MYLRELGDLLMVVWTQFQDVDTQDLGLSPFVCLSNRCSTILLHFADQSLRTAACEYFGGVKLVVAKHDKVRG